MRRRGERGNSIVETAMFLPVLLLLLVGMVQLGRITYTYYALKKTLYAAATYLASLQGVNFCDSGDASIAAAKQFAITGSPDLSTSPIQSLTADMIQVQTECIDPSTDAVGECVSNGCDTAAGGPHPDFIVVSIPDGYPIAPRFPFMLVDPILLRPQIRVPFGGT